MWQWWNGNMWLIFEYRKPGSTCLFIFPIWMVMIQLEECNLVTSSFQMQVKFDIFNNSTFISPRVTPSNKIFKEFDVKMHIMGLLNLWGLTVIIDSNWWKTAFNVCNGGCCPHMLFAFPTFSSAWFQYTIATCWILTFAPRGCPLIQHFWVLKHHFSEGFYCSPTNAI